MAHEDDEIEITILKVYQGERFNERLTYTDENGDPVDFSSGYTARMSFRRTATDGRILLDLTDGDGIELGDGWIDLDFSTAVFPPGTVVTDLWVYPTEGDPELVMPARFEVSGPRVTR